MHHELCIDTVIVDIHILPCTQGRAGGEGEGKGRVGTGMGQREGTAKKREGGERKGLEESEEDGKGKRNRRSRGWNWAPSTSSANAHAPFHMSIGDLPFFPPHSLTPSLSPVWEHAQATKPTRRKYYIQYYIWLQRNTEVFNEILTCTDILTCD